MQKPCVFIFYHKSNWKQNGSHKTLEAVSYLQLLDWLYNRLKCESVFQFLFVLINGAVKSNSRSLGYFGIKSPDLPRVGIYDGTSDMKWLLPGEISTEAVREFCQSFLRGELKVSGQGSPDKMFLTCNIRLRYFSDCTEGIYLFMSSIRNNCCW